MIVEPPPSPPTRRTTASPSSFTGRREKAAVPRRVGAALVSHNKMDPNGVFSRQISNNLHTSLSAMRPHFSAQQLLYASVVRALRRLQAVASAPSCCSPSLSRRLSHASPPPCSSRRWLQKCPAPAHARSCTHVHEHAPERHKPTDQTHMRNTRGWAAAVHTALMPSRRQLVRQSPHTPYAPCRPPPPPAAVHASRLVVYGPRLGRRGGGALTRRRATCYGCATRPRSQCIAPSWRMAAAAATWCSCRARTRVSVMPQLQVAQLGVSLGCGDGRCRRRRRRRPCRTSRRRARRPTRGRGRAARPPAAAVAASTTGGGCVGRRWRRRPGPRRLPSHHRSRRARRQPGGARPPRTPARRRPSRRRAWVARAAAAHADDVEEVDEHLRFDLEVERRLGAEGRVEVHLQQPRLRILVQHHVEAKQLEALPVGPRCAAARSRGATQRVGSAVTSLDDEIVDPPPHRRARSPSSCASRRLKAEFHLSPWSPPPRWCS